MPDTTAASLDLARPVAARVEDLLGHMTAPLPVRPRAEHRLASGALTGDLT